MAKQKEPTERQLRVAEEIKHIISQVLLKEDLYEPEVNSTMIMITGVKVSPDFSWATIQVHSIGKADENKMCEALNRHKGLFRKQVGDKIRLRIVPDLRFCLDNRFEEMDKVNALFENPIVKADIAKKNETS